MKITSEQYDWFIQNVVVSALKENGVSEDDITHCFAPPVTAFSVVMAAHDTADNRALSEITSVGVPVIASSVGHFGQTPMVTGSPAADARAGRSSTTSPRGSAVQRALDVMGECARARRDRFALPK